MSKKIHQISTITTFLGKWIVSLVMLHALLFGQTWEDLGLKGEWIMTVKCHPANPDTIFAGTYGGFLFRSNNAGTDWIPLLANFKTIDVCINPNKPSVIYVAGRGASTSHVILKSIDDGVSWQASQSGISETNYGSFVTFSPGTLNIMFAGTVLMSLSPNSYAYQSNDTGSSWTKMNFSPGNAYCIAFDPDDPDIIYIGGSQLYKTTDAGLTWKKLKNFGSAVLCIAINPWNSDEVYIASMSNGIYKSVDGGTSWTESNNGLTAKKTYSIRVNPKSGDQVFAAVLGKGVFISYDKAGSWLDINTGLTSKDALFLDLDSVNDRLYCGTKDGLYRLQLNHDHVTDEIPDVPRHLQLLAPYPNPFNARLTIPFTLNYPASHIRLDIFDLNGKKIKSLAADGLPVGYQRFLWDGLDQSGAAMPSGLYYYRLICDDLSAGFGKVILLK